MRIFHSCLTNFHSLSREEWMKSVHSCDKKEQKWPFSFQSSDARIHFLVHILRRILHTDNFIVIDQFSTQSINHFLSSTTDQPKALTERRCTERRCIFPWWDETTSRSYYLNSEKNKRPAEADIIAAGRNSTRDTAKALIERTEVQQSHSISQEVQTSTSIFQEVHERTAWQTKE